MARVLVTGGTGFIGAHLVRDCLAQGDEVTVLARPGGDPWRLADIRDRIALIEVDPADAGGVAAVLGRARPERVFHLAALTRAPARDDLGDLDAALAANVAPLRALLGAMDRAGGPPPVLVRAGSLAELGEADRVQDPEGPERPRDAYGLSALMGTHVLRLARARRGWPLVTARLCLTYGGDQSGDFLIPDLIRKGLAGRPAALRQPGARRDLIHVRDCVAALQAVARHAAGLPPVVAVSTGRPAAMGHVARTIAALIEGGSPPDEHLDGPRAPAAEGPVLSCRPSPELAALGWQPRMGLAEGLRDTITWERARVMPPQECLA